MRGRPPDTTNARPIPPGQADPGGRDLLARAVMAATWYLEVRAGRRPAAHLRDWVSPAVARQLDGLVRRRRRQPGGAAALSLVRVWAQRQPHVAHVVVVLRDGHRARPVAMAIEVGRTDPRIVALGLPEDHPARPDDGTTGSPEADATTGPSTLDALDDLESRALRDGATGSPAPTRIIGVATAAVAEASAAVQPSAGPVRRRGSA